MSEIIVVKVIIRTIGTDVDLELPMTSTPQDIIFSLLENDELGIPKIDPDTNEPIDYRLVKVLKNEKEIEMVQDISIGEQGVIRNATLAMVRDIVPG